MNTKTHDHKLDALVLDLVEWVAKQPRTYAQTMDAWRTSCPRLAVWEDAVDRGFIVRASGANGEALVKVTASGFRVLRAVGRLPPARRKSGDTRC